MPPSLPEARSRPDRSRDRSRLRSASLLGILLLAAAVPALAPRHTELDTAVPGADAVLDEPVEEILLTFTTSVNAQLSRITLSAVGGDTIASGAEHPPGREDQMRLVLASPLGSGSYRVDWRALSPDGHVVEGVYGFAVDVSEPEAQESATAPGDADAGAGTPPGIGEEGVQAPSPGFTTGTAQATGTAWIRWIQILGAALLIGAVGARVAVLPTTGLKTAQPDAWARMVGGFSRYAWGAALLLLAALPLRLTDQLSTLGEGVGLSEALVLLFETAWGGGWLLHLGAVALAVIGLALSSPHGRRSRGWVVVALAALILPMVSALQGHAWGAEDARALSVLSLYLHVLGSGLWLGGLLLLVLVGLPALKRVKQAEAEGAEATGREHPEAERAEATTEGAGPPTGSAELRAGEDAGWEDAEAEEANDEAAAEPASRPKPALARLVNAFSQVALPAAVLIVASGVVNAWVELGAIGPLFGSAYGRTLLLKLAVVAGALFLGYYNWRRVRPTLVERPDAGALRIPASIEAALGVVILFITAVLVATPTPPAP